MNKSNRKKKSDAKTSTARVEDRGDHSRLFLEIPVPKGLTHDRAHLLMMDALGMAERVMVLVLRLPEEGVVKLLEERKTAARAVVAERNGAKLDSAAPEIELDPPKESDHNFKIV